MADHLKLAFSNYEPDDPRYEADNEWRDSALTLQKIVLDYTLEQWPKGTMVSGKLEKIQAMSDEVYADYISTPFWEGLIREIRKCTDVPFRHPALNHFSTNAPAREVLHSPPKSWTAVPKNSAMMEQAHNVIRDEDSEELSVTGGSADGRGRLSGRNSKERQESGSGQSDALDYIIVGDSGSTTSTQSKKRKQPMVKQEVQDVCISFNLISRPYLTVNWLLGNNQPLCLPKAKQS
jgi:hypothetical protein